MLGFVHGRFQVLHNDHLKYIMAARERCGRLIVGITNPDPGSVRDTGADPHRSLSCANPFTFWERLLMVEAALAGEGMKPGEFLVIPFPINRPEFYPCYLPREAACFITIYDPWGEEKKQNLEAAGYRVEVLWKRPPEQKGIRGTEVRERMAQGLDWEPLVPPAVAALIKEKGWEKRPSLK